MRNHYGVEPGETFWAASDVGWVVGHFLHLLRTAAARLHDGAVRGQARGTPDAGTFWRVIAEHGVAAMFTAPTAFRAIKKEDPKGEHIARYDLRAFRTLFLAGERADSETIKWAEAHLKVPGLRPLVADGDGVADLRQSVGLGALPSNTARRRCRCRATSWPRSTPRASP
jgi:propionyl-CoA synthetase